MLVGLLRSQTLVSFITVLLVAVLLVVNVVLQGMPQSGINQLLYAHWAFEWLSYSPDQVFSWITYGLIIGSALIVRIRFRETATTLGSVNLSSVVFLVILTTQHNVLVTRPDLLVAALLMNTVFILLMFTYKRESVLSELFHVGLLMGFACLFLGQNILLFASVLFALFTLRPGSVKEVAVLLLGVLMTLIFVALFLIWNDRPLLAFQLMVQTSWLSELSVSKINVGHLLVFLAILVSLPKVLSDLTTATVHERNITSVNIGWAIGVVLAIVLLGLGWQAGLILAAFPLSTFISRSLASINRWWLADLMLLLLVAAPFLRSLWQF